MEHSKTISLTKKLLRDYFDMGNTALIRQFLLPDAVAFGLKSYRYYVGADEVEKLLRDMYRQLEACRLNKMGCVAHDVPGGTTLCVNIIYSTRDRVRNMLQVLVMYREVDGGLRIAGIHIQRDMRHELTYRMVSAQMLNKGENSDSMDEIMDMVSSYVNCAYVQYRTDENLPFEYFSDELWRMLKYKSSEDFAQETDLELKSIIHPQDFEASRADVKRQLLSRDNYQIEYRLCRADGTYIWCMECGRYMYDKKSGVGIFNTVISNLSPLKQTHATFLYSLRHDRLTRLYNKKAFCRRTAEVLEQYPDTEFEIMRFNISRFKVINDLFGEENGDKLLKYVAHFLQSIQLEPCVYGRLYADNFIVFYPTANNMREHLIHSLQMLAESYALDYRIDFYFGVYRVTDRTLSVTMMLDRATMGLSKAAHNGLVTCGEYDDDMRENVVNEQVIVNNMKSSLKNGDFIVYLQPKYELMSERVVGAEALVRWIHPQLGFISPGRFIPIFEQNGFIYQLDKYVWEKTCQLLRSDIDAGRPVLPISINVSRIDLYSPNIVQVFKDLVEKYDLPPRLLELELTESAYVENPQQIIEIAKTLQSHGFPILMDDFGSGYSSLNMLKDMPVDILKIDLNFLSDTQGEDNGRGGNILNSVVRMAKWLHIPVIAEGVETQQQVDFLRTIGCECVQGYFYSKPVPIDVYEQLIARNGNDKLMNEELHLGAHDTADMMDMSAQLTVLFNASGCAIGLYELLGDDHIEVLRVNEGYFKLFHVQRDEVYGPDKTVFDNIDDGDREALLAAIAEAQKTKRPVECRLRRKLGNGSGMLYVRARISIIYEERRRTLLYIFMEDITALEKEHQKLTWALERLRAIAPDEVSAIEHELSQGD